MFSFKPENVPADILQPILAQLTERRDLHAAALVSHTFNVAATPLLYRTIESIISKGRLCHPSTTLLKRPDLAQFVRHVTETGAVHGTRHPSHPTVTSDTVAALRLCTGLESMTWKDDSFTTDTIFLSFLSVIRVLPIREITIHSYGDLGEKVWAQLKQLTGFRKVSIWCMEGPPRVLQGWSDKLGETLTHLELGRCAGVPPTILISVLSQVPLLRELCLKGAPSAAIPTLLPYLPNLITLDTEFLGSGIYRPSNMPLPRLRNLTVRTSSMDSMGPLNLWIWILQLLPYPSLRSFTLNAFSVQGHTIVPRSFIIHLAQMHKETLKEFMVSMTQLTLEGVEYLCTTCPHLEHLACSVASPDVNAITQAIANGRNLRSLKLLVQWIPNMSPSSDWTGVLEVAKVRNTKERISERFTMDDAKAIMLSKASRIRVIEIDLNVYTGQWVRRQLAGGKAELVFEVSGEVAQDTWR